VVPLHNIDFDVVKVQKLYDITKPWLEKVGALRKKRGCTYFDTPSSEALYTSAFQAICGEWGTYSSFLYLGIKNLSP
jgi:hypothetical protein